MPKKISRRQAIKTGALAGVGAALASPLPTKAAAGQRPNFLFILTDDQRYDALSAAGNSVLTTPNMDWIAKTGARLSNAFATTSLCSPSRACFLTGKYAHSHGVTNNITPWQEHNVTFLELLKRAGYFTGFIGKWHMPGRGLPDLAGQGKVDRFISFTAVGGQGVYWDCPMVANGKSISTRGYVADVLNDFAMDFLREAQGKNFCLYLAHKTCHAPFSAPEKYRGIYDQAELNLPAEYLAKGLKWKYSSQHQASGFMRKAGMEAELKKYYETLKALDDSVTRVFEQLDRLKLIDNTVVIWAGDNGFLWGEHNLVDKRFAYEESIRIPLLVRAPGIIPNPGANIDRITLNIDLAPSILDLAGLPTPSDMQGRSFKPLLQGKAAAWRTGFFYEYFYDPPFPVPTLFAARTEDMKYIRYENDKLPKELYLLKSDPREQLNLAADHKYGAQKSRMADELDRLREAAGLSRKR